MRLYDITVPLADSTPVYPGDPPFRLVHHTRRDRGDPFSLTSICASSHLGTHVDAPSHFVAGGATVDTIPLEMLVGPAQVVHLAGCDAVGPAELEGAGIARYTRRLLLRTDPSDGMGGQQNRLTSRGAQWIVDQGIALIGIDAISVDGVSGGDYPCHRILLSAGVVIVEQLHLQRVPPGAYNLVCLPMRVVGAEGALARVILEQDSS